MKGFRRKKTTLHGLSLGPLNSLFVKILNPLILISLLEEPQSVVQVVSSLTVENLLKLETPLDRSPINPCSQTLSACLPNLSSSPGRLSG